MPGNALERLLIPPDGGARDDAWWRARVLDIVATALVGFGFLAYVPSVVLAIRTGATDVVVLDTIAFAAILAVAAARRLPHVVRAGAVVLIGFVLGAYFVAGYGPVAAGMLWLLATPVLAAVLFGLRGTLVTLLLLTLLVLALGVALASGRLAWGVGDPAALTMYLVRAASLLPLAGLTALAVALLSRGLAREVAERARAEQARSELAAAVEQSEDIIVLTDPDGRIRYANARTRALAGPRADTLAEESVLQWVTQVESGDGRDLSVGAFWGEVLAGGTWRGTVRFVTPTPPMPTSFVIAGTFSPVRDASGAVVSVLGVFRDARREHALEEQLRQSAKLQAIGTLASGIAHDFNNLLQPILLHSELLAELLPAGHEGQRLLDDMHQAADRGRTLIRRILTFTREARLERAPLAVHPVVEDAVALVRASLPPRVALVLACEHGLHVECDASELQQLVLNLVNNAAQAMPDGGEIDVSTTRTYVANDPELTRQFGRAESVCLLTVRDQGTGMDAATRARIFEPFFTTKPVGAGTGLGLATVHGTVSALGGLIRVDSAPGVGTTMQVFLPLAEPYATTTAASPAATLGGARRRLLVVDDEAPVLRAVTRLLESDGWTVTACEDPGDAERLATAGGYACVLTDLSMPSLSGLELARRLHAADPRLPIVMMTGYLEHDDVARAPSVGVRRVVAKPFTRAHLLAAIADAVAESPDAA